MFPDDVETITMTRQDYDRNMENLIYENVELKQRINKALEYIKNVSNNGMFELTMEEIEEVLDILKGNDTNEK